MTMDKGDIEYILDQRIKSLNGRVELVLNNEPADNDSLEDLNNKIQVLTNILEML